VAGGRPPEALCDEKRDHVSSSRTQTWRRVAGSS
jgi:hypothetical protein